MPESIYKPEPGQFYVYVYWNPLKPGCPPFYVGKGKGRRAFQHLTRKDCNRHKQRTLGQIRNAGLTPNITCAYFGTDAKKALWVETFLIDMWGRKEFDEGGILTNLLRNGGADVGRSGPRNGMFGRHHTEKAKAKMSADRKGIPRKITPEVRQQVSAQAMLRWKDPDYRAKMSRRKAPQPWKGKKLSQEHRNNISKTLKGRPGKTPSPEVLARIVATLCKKQYDITFPDGHQERIVNLKKFCRDNNLNEGAMWSTARGRVRQHKGYTVAHVQNVKSI